jgi:hypothetical protein
MRLTARLRMTTLSVTICATALPGLAMDYNRNVRIVAWAAQALTAEGLEADMAVNRLRDAGSRSVDVLMAMRKAAADPSRIDALIDRVAGQRYACVSGLYWHTDLDKAKAEAALSGKPILSLRMLGQLTEEFSCANSRFFRTTLYANEEIARQLRERFVLHWKSVRPVPRVTIDFGDGRKIERTVTGNSVHYVLAADGQPLDALPGLYGPRQFQSWLSEAESLHENTRSLPATDRSAYLQQYHVEHERQIANRWARDLAAVAPNRPLDTLTEPESEPAVVNASADQTAKLPSTLKPTVVRATEMAMPKGMVEMPILRLLARDPAQLAAKTTDDVWNKIAARAEHAVELDQSTRKLIRQENPAAVAGALAVTKRKVEDPILRLVRNLQSSIALDSVRNEYTLHRQLHGWFAAGAIGGDVEQLNERVYAELFLTPSSDPWLGLTEGDAYTALENGGVVSATP